MLLSGSFIADKSSLSSSSHRQTNTKPLDTSEDGYGAGKNFYIAISVT